MRLAELQAAGRHPQLPLRVTWRMALALPNCAWTVCCGCCPGSATSVPANGVGARCWPSCWWAARPHGISSANWKGRVCSRPRG